LIVLLVSPLLVRMPESWNLVRNNRPGQI